jgi:hypothetical protein
VLQPASPGARKPARSGAADTARRGLSSWARPRGPIAARRPAAPPSPTYRRASRSSFSRALISTTSAIAPATTETVEQKSSDHQHD